MKNILIINGHEHYVYSPGKLNEAMQNLAINTLTEKGYNVQTTVVQNGYNVQEELDKHVWADCIIIQSPVNWMMVPWMLKKYFDEGYRKFNRPFLRVWQVGSGRASAALGTDRAQIGGSCVGFRHRGATQRLSA